MVGRSETAGGFGSPSQLRGALPSLGAPVRPMGIALATTDSTLVAVVVGSNQFLAWSVFNGTVWGPPGFDSTTPAYSSSGRIAAHRFDGNSIDVALLNQDANIVTPPAHDDSGPSRPRYDRFVGNDPLAHRPSSRPGRGIRHRRRRHARMPLPTSDLRRDFADWTDAGEALCTRSRTVRPSSHTTRRRDRRPRVPGIATRLRSRLMHCRRVRRRLRSGLRCRGCR